MARPKKLEQSPPLTADDAMEKTKGSNAPALLVRRPSVRSKFPETASSAYVLDWEGGVCRQRLLNRAEDLLMEAVGRRRLTIVQGLPLDLVQVLRDSLGVSPEFLEAHAGRRRYRPSSRQYNGCGFVSFEYPELVKVCHPAVGPDLGYKPSARQSDLVDVMDEAPFHPISGDGLAALFCHASLWMGSKADVLFLDRQVWHDTSSQLRKARRPLSVTRSWQSKIDESQADGTSVWNVLIAEGDELPGLEESLLRTFRYTDVSREILPGLLCDAVHGKWLDFYETFPSYSLSGPLQNATLYWQATESLEQNIDLANDPEWHIRMGATKFPDWHHLLERLQRRVAITRLASNDTQTSWLLPTTRAMSTAQPQTRGSGPPGKSTSAYPDIESNWLDGKEADRRALDRITYLGGILLPFIVVSAILSMNKKYSPNAPHFWIFWVASIGASMLCLLVIYLDQLRCLEVFFEVAATETVEMMYLSSNKTPDHDINNGGVEHWTIPQSRLRRQSSRFSTEVIVDMPQLGDGNVEAKADSAVNPTVILQRHGNGVKPKAWQKRQLGWGGAMKKVVGYYRWMGGMPVQISRSGSERFRMETI